MICGKDTINNDYLTGSSEKYMQLHFEKYKEKYF